MRFFTTSGRAGRTARTATDLLPGWLRDLSRPFQGRPDTEHAQALVRLALLGLILVYMFVLQALGEAANASSATVLAFVALEFLIALGILIAIYLRPGINHVRRVIGMLADYSLLGIAMFLMGRELSPLYVVLLWVTVGNGLRYGHSYLLGAIAMATLSFGLVVAVTPFWQTIPFLAWSLVAGLVAIPLYLSSLLRALVRATREAQRANEAKTRFLANMSHEFRTPLNGIVGMAELLVSAQLRPEQRESADVIHASAKALQQLVEDVLDISAIEAGKLRKIDEPFQLSGLLRGIQLMLGQSAQEKGLRFEMVVTKGVPDHLIGDPSHLRQVLVNLLSNAIKFTEQGRVSLEVSLLPQRIGQREDLAELRFSVRDTGIGIPASALGRMFEAFEQVDSGHARRYGGTGLGTTIAKALTEMMAGHISVESREGVGSHFWVDLPLRRADVAGADAPSMTAKIIDFEDPFVRHRARVKPMRLLIADDQAANLMVLSRLLEKAGHRTVTVISGDEVLGEIEKSSFSAAIVDLHMPGLSGIDMMKQARVMEAGGRRTPFIVLTADATSESMVECERAGAYAFLSKPISVPRLLDTLAELAASERSEPDVEVVETTTTSTDLITSTVLEELSELGLGASFIDDFIEQCTHDARQCLAALDVTGSAAEWDEFRDHCHALKGVASNMGAVKLASYAGDAMRLPNWQLPQTWRGRVAELKRQFDLSSQALRASRQSGARREDPDGN